jgi:hypothetical protein
MGRATPEKQTSAARRRKLERRQSGILLEDGTMLDTGLAIFDPISLEELNKVALMDRVEVKYVMPVQGLANILEQVRPAYSVLEIAGERRNHYRTLYYDTADFAMFRRHHMGASERYKVRARQYVESHYAFLEIKHKTKKKRTVKNRIPTPELVTHLAGEAEEFMDDFLHSNCPYAAGELEPKLWNAYTRITLANKTACERVTLDLDLSFTWQGRQTSLHGLAIAEVKQEAHASNSPFVALMRRHGVRQTGFSKYCLGVSLLYPQVKHNRFNALQRLVARTVQGGNHVYGSVSRLSGELSGRVDDRAWDLLPSPA